MAKESDRRPARRSARRAAARDASGDAAAIGDATPLGDAAPPHRAAVRGHSAAAHAAAARAAATHAAVHAAAAQAVADDDGPNEGTDARVRRRLRELRQARGLTLAAVAERAGMAVSTLSRLESGARRLALDHLPALARALDVTVDELLAVRVQPDPRVRSTPHTRDGTTYWELTNDPTASGLRAYKLRISAERNQPQSLRTHAGHDWVYVLRGRLRLILGADDLVLEPGEAAEFDCWTPHWLGSVDGPVELIAIFGPQGERLHLRG